MESIQFEQEQQQNNRPFGRVFFGEKSEFSTPPPPSKKLKSFTAYSFSTCTSQSHLLQCVSRTLKAMGLAKTIE